MLAKKYRLSSHEIKNVFEKGQWYYRGAFSFKLVKNDLPFSRFAVVVGRKVTRQAVERNKIRRQIMEIIRLNQEIIPKGFDVIIILRPVIVFKKFLEVKKELINELKLL